MATNSYGWASPQTQNATSGRVAGNGPPYKPPGYLGPLPGGQGTPSNPGLGNSGPFNPQYAYGDPGKAFGSGPSLGMGNPFMNPATSPFINDPNLRSPGKYAEENFRNLMEGFATYGFTPFANADIAYQTLGMNRDFGGWDREEQRRMNNLGYGLSRNAAMREDAALNFGMRTNERDFGEDTRRFNTDFGLRSEMERGRLGLDNRAETNRMTLGLRNADIADYDARTGRLRADNDFTLGNRGLDVTSRGQDFDRELGLGRIAQDRYATDSGANVAMRGQDFDRELGQGRLGLDRDMGMGRLGLDTELGRGALGFQNRELDTNEAFRRSQLAQEAELTRERYQNDLTQSRYAAFGRAQAPNARAVRSWY